MTEKSKQKSSRTSSKTGSKIRNGKSQASTSQAKYEISPEFKETLEEVGDSKTVPDKVNVFEESSSFDEAMEKIHKAKEEGQKMSMFGGIDIDDVPQSIARGTYKCALTDVRY